MGMVSKKQLKKINLILITGQSGTGKSYLSTKLNQYIERSFVIKTDDYYRTGFFSKFFSKIINGYYDKKISVDFYKLKKDINDICFNKKLINLPKYNFKTKQRNYEQLCNEEIEHLIIEGIFAFNISKYIFKNARIKIFIINKKEICFQRRFRRDIKSRGRSASEIKKRFDKGWELFNKSNLKNDRNILRINSDEKIFQKSIEYILRKI